MTPEPKKTGSVIWYDQMRGHGYLRVEGVRHDLYLHAADVRRSDVDPRALLNGIAILCNVTERKGRSYAIDVEIVAQPQA